MDGYVKTATGGYGGGIVTDAKRETHLDAALNRLIAITDSINNATGRLHRIADGVVGPVPENAQKSEPNAPSPSHMVFRLQDALNSLQRQAEWLTQAANRFDTL